MPKRYEGEAKREWEKFQRESRLLPNIMLLGAEEQEQLSKARVLIPHRGGMNNSSYAGVKAKTCAVSGFHGQNPFTAVKASRNVTPS